MSANAFGVLAAVLAVLAIAVAIASTGSTSYDRRAYATIAWTLASLAGAASVAAAVVAWPA